MEKSTDAKRVVGARVHTKAHFVLAEADAKRKFGSLWNSKLLNGTVIAVDTINTAKRVSVFLDARWELPGEHRVKRVNIRSVVNGEAPVFISTPASARATQLTQATEAEVEEGNEDHQLESEA
jgi:hypothetical protein